MKNATDFATEKMPLRGSMLKFFVECPLRYELTLGTDRVANGPMETGSAVHWLIEEFERTKSPIGEKHYKQAEKKWPQATPDAIREYFAGYARKAGELTAKYGSVIGIETQGTTRLAPAKIDPTQKEIVINGTWDQLRALEGDDGVFTYNLIDFKVSTQPIADMIKTYALQLASYTIGVGQKFNTDKVKCFVANPLLMAKPRSMFIYPAKFTIAKCNRLLDIVRLHIAAIRSGVTPAIAGYSCKYCPKRSPENCS